MTSLDELADYGNSKPLASKKTVKKTEENIEKVMNQTQGEKKEVQEETLVCPFPEWKEYQEIRDTLTLDQQKLMQANIGKKDADGKMEIIPMKKKFSILKAEHNGKDIFDRSYVDRDGSRGTKGITYMTGSAAERECIKQGKKLFDSESEVEQFISLFPGKNTKERIFNFVKLFGLEKTGYWNPSRNKWDNVGSIGYAKLSTMSENGLVYGVEWDDDADLRRSFQKFPSPFVACEDILKAA